MKSFPLAFTVIAVAILAFTPDCEAGKRRGRSCAGPTVAMPSPKPAPYAPAVVPLGKKTAYSDVLQFTAEWCAPCKQQSPIIESLRKQGYAVRAIDIDKHPEIAREYAVQAIPDFVLVINGKVVDRATGLQSESRLIGMLSRVTTPIKTATTEAKETKSITASIDQVAIMDSLNQISNYLRVNFAATTWTARRVPGVRPDFLPDAPQLALDVSDTPAP